MAMVSYDMEGIATTKVTELRAKRVERESKNVRVGSSTRENGLMIRSMAREGL